MINYYHMAMNIVMIQTLACGTYGWFQQALIRLCVCAAVAVIAVLILRPQIVCDETARIALLWRCHGSMFVEAVIEVRERDSTNNEEDIWQLT